MRVPGGRAVKGMSMLIVKILLLALLEATVRGAAAMKESYLSGEVYVLWHGGRDSAGRGGDRRRGRLLPARVRTRGRADTRADRRVRFAAGGPDADRERPGG